MVLICLITYKPCICHTGGFSLMMLQGIEPRVVLHAVVHASACMHEQHCDLWSSGAGLHVLKCQAKYKRAFLMEGTRDRLTRIMVQVTIQAEYQLTLCIVLVRYHVELRPAVSQMGEHSQKICCGTEHRHRCSLHREAPIGRELECLAILQQQRYLPYHRQECAGNNLSKEVGSRKHVPRQCIINYMNAATYHRVCFAIALLI